MSAEIDQKDRQRLRVRRAYLLLASRVLVIGLCATTTTCALLAWSHAPCPSGPSPSQATPHTKGPVEAARTTASTESWSAADFARHDRHGAHWVEVVDAQGRPKLLATCQARDPQPVASQPPTATDSLPCDCGCGVPWEVFSQGEYVGHARTPHLPEYRLRVDDQLEFVYHMTRSVTQQRYQLNVGDRIRVESMIDASLDRDLTIQPDGMITLRILGQVPAAGRTIPSLRDDLESRYQKYYKVPEVTVTPLRVNTPLEELRASVGGQGGPGKWGQIQRARVTPAGTIQLPIINSVPAHGLTLDELKQEVEERYAQLFDGVGVTPRLAERAAAYVYVVGEVRDPGRFTLHGPTSTMQAITLAGGWKHRGDLRHVVVFRRREDWGLMATRLDLRAALSGSRLCPPCEIWMRDNDIVVVPKAHFWRRHDLVDLLFKRRIYGALPAPCRTVNFRNLSAL